MIYSVKDIYTYRRLKSLKIKSAYYIIKNYSLYLSSNSWNNEFSNYYSGSHSSQRGQNAGVRMVRL
jgi:hypothetical protein